MPTLVPRSAPRWFTDPIVDLLARAGATPNMLTIVGVAGNILAAVLAGSGEFVAAGILVLASSSLDTLDGALARATGKATDFGSVFDAVMDRVSEAAVLFGLLAYFGGIGRTEDQQLALVAVVASLLVSYIRARAEIVGVELREGLFSRAPRVLVLAAGLILEPYWDVWVSSVHIMLCVLALYAQSDLISLLVHIYEEAAE